MGAELIVVAGDPVARTLLVRELGSDLAAVTVTVEREVSADSGEAARAADEAVAQHVAQRSQEHFEHWRTQLAHDRGVQGLAATMTALRDGAAAELVLVDHPESALTAWVGPGGIELAATAGELTGRGVPDPVQDRADAALARGLCTSDAQLYVLPRTWPPAPGPRRTVSVRCCACRGKPSPDRRASARSSEASRVVSSGREDDAAARGPEVGSCAAQQDVRGRPVPALPAGWPAGGRSRRTRPGAGPAARPG